MTATQLFKSDLRTAKAQEQSGQPAWVQWLETLFCSAGLHALWLHRLAYGLHRLNIPLVPRLISQLNRFLTGIEIHPGAQLGRGVFITGGLGVVIGETAIVGDGTIIYEGVTLGGTGKDYGKRHPTIGNQVIIGAGAKVLGNIVIGDRTRIAAGAVVLRDAPEGSMVIGIPGRAIAGFPEGDCDWQPYLEAKIIHTLFERVKQLEAELKLLQPPSSSLPSEAEVHQDFYAESDRLIEDFCDGLGI